MRFASCSALLVAAMCLVPGLAAATHDGSLGVYADLTATQTSATFAIGVPRTLFILAQLDGLTAAGLTGAEFRVDGLPEDWFAFVSPNPAANIVLGNPMRANDGVHRANIAFPSCTAGTSGRVLLYTVVVIANSVVEPRYFVVRAGDPPTDPSDTTPILVRCDDPVYSTVAALGDSFRVEVRAPQDLDYSQLAGYDGLRGVRPQSGLDGDLFHFRVAYASSDNLPPSPGWPQVELDANGDGDALDDGEGAFTMSPADQDSTLMNGKEYRYDVALAAPPGGRYRYRFMALDGRGAAVPGTATAWNESLLVGGDLVNLAVVAEGVSVFPTAPWTGNPATVKARIENRSDRRVDNVRVVFQNVFGTTFLDRTIATLGPRSSTEVACIWRFLDPGFQPVVVRVDPGDAIAESDESDNVASHAAYVGPPGTTGNLILSGLPPNITVPPVAPFGLQGHAAYAVGSYPAAPVRGASVLVRSSWDATLPLRSDADGDFNARLMAPLVPGAYRLTFVVDDGARADSAVVNVDVTPFGGGLPPHGPDLVMHLAAAPAGGCPAASAALTWSVENRGDQASPPSSVRLLSGGIVTVASASVGGLEPGASAVLDPVAVPLSGPGLYSFTAHVDPASELHEMREDNNAASASVRVQPACLDLALESLQFRTVMLCAGETLSFEARVVNRGCEASAPARVACSIDGVEIATTSLPAVQPGDYAMAFFGAPFATAGCRELVLAIDPDGTAGDDCVQDNDVLAAELCPAGCGEPPPPTLPDFRFVPCSLFASNPRAAVGEVVTFRATLENAGGADATGQVRVDWEFDGHSYGGSTYVGPLAQGEQVVVESPPWTFARQPHILTAVVDPLSQSEPPTFNNAISGLVPYDVAMRFIAQCPPSVPSMFSDCSVCIGDTVEIQARLTNEGLFDCDSVTVEFRDQLAGGALLERLVAHDVLAGAECTAPPIPLSIRTAFAGAGRHTIQVRADPEDAWPEVENTNNQIEQWLDVGCVVLPDLVAEARLPVGSTPQPGDTVRVVEVRVTNQGGGSASGVTARLRLNGTLLCDLDFGPVAAGATQLAICETPWVVTGESACTQVLEACADPLNLIAEVSEYNNCGTSGITGGPDTDLALAEYSIRVTPPNPAVGQPVTIVVALYSTRGVESTCLLTAEWSLDGVGWFPIGIVPLHLPGGVYLFPEAATFVWTAVSPNAYLRFQLHNICPHDVYAYNDVAILTLPWFDIPGTPVTVSDLAAESTPDGVVVRWRASGGEARFVLERRVEGELDWTRLPEAMPASTGPDGAAYEVVDADAEPGARLEYRLFIEDDAGRRIAGSLEVVHDAAVTRVVRLHAVRPNPFRPGGALEYSVPEAQSVELCVYDAAGRFVVRLDGGTQPAGRHAVTWNGRDHRGGRVPAGIYFCRLTAGAVQQTRRVVLLP